MATTQAKVNWYCQKRDYHSLNELKAFAKELINLIWTLRRKMDYNQFLAVVNGNYRSITKERLKSI